MANMSTFVALYQAGESLYELFDKVLLIHEGRCAYFGPMEEAKEYFESLGFECPPRWTTADFLTSTTDEHARMNSLTYDVIAMSTNSSYRTCSERLGRSNTPNSGRL